MRVVRLRSSTVTIRPLRTDQEPLSIESVKEAIAGKGLPEKLKQEIHNTLDSLIKATKLDDRGAINKSLSELLNTERDIRVGVKEVLGKDASEGEVESLTINHMVDAMSDRIAETDKALVTERIKTYLQNRINDVFSHDADATLTELINDYLDNRIAFSNYIHLARTVTQLDDLEAALKSGSTERVREEAIKAGASKADAERMVNGLFDLKGADLALVDFSINRATLGGWERFTSFWRGSLVATFGNFFLNLKSNALNSMALSLSRFPRVLADMAVSRATGIRTRILDSRAHIAIQKTISRETVASMWRALSGEQEVSDFAKYESQRGDFKGDYDGFWGKKNLVVDKLTDFMFGVAGSS